jgi:hypothetical protein
MLNKYPVKIPKKRNLEYFTIDPFTVIRSKHTSKLGFILSTTDYVYYLRLNQQLTGPTPMRHQPHVKTRSTCVYHSIKNSFQDNFFMKINHNYQIKNHNSQGVQDLRNKEVNKKAYQKPDQL